MIVRGAMVAVRRNDGIVVASVGLLVVQGRAVLAHI